MKWPLVTWGKDLEFGIPAIDDEHKRLMELANRVYAMVKTVDDPKALIGGIHRIALLRLPALRR